MDESNLPYWLLPVIVCLFGALCDAICQKSGGSRLLPLPPQPSGGMILGKQMLDYQAGQDGVQILRLITRYTYSAFATQTFGMDIPCADDPAIDFIHETGLAQILGTIPGRHMVDIFTWLNYLPPWLKPWEQDARKRFKRDLKWCMDRLERIKDPKFAGQFMPDAFLPSVLRASDQAGFTTQEAAYLSLQLIIGAADTVGYMASFYQLS
ncbi:hypothetical protein BDW68DRAFT_174555 [Aspergillus falconensis]